MAQLILSVSLEDRTYPIFIGGDYFSSVDTWEPLVAGRQVMVVTNTTLSELLLPQLIDCLQQLSVPVQKLQNVILPDGEQYKTLDCLGLIFDALLEHRFDRRCLIIALGGGVVGDMSGFAAACYQRGVEFIQVPTTLLSQVDSSVGGKTGVNHPLGKNMIGAFYQPKAVIIDTSILVTLPARELSAGLAEVIKYGLIADTQFLAWLEDNMDLLLQGQQEALAYAIYRSCQIKAEVVGQDEKEGGIRAILNFGHTYGHAIENTQGYGVWLHGEAVGAGMIMAAELSQMLGWISVEDLNRARRLIQRAGLPVTPPISMNQQDFIDGMSVDKKVLDGQLRLVLLKQLGQAVVTSEFNHQVLDQQLSALN
ncbi:MAG: 3-dehydroquinate synthase [Marinagarivorans sp.]|nr:3-dehydroquinate synthase [Marinagarivorans sp.]